MLRNTFLVFCFLLYGCNHSVKPSQDIQLKFLDEYVLSNDLQVDTTLIGGLSGIDYRNGIYYIACDDDKNPRYYRTQIRILNNKIDTVHVTSTVLIEKSEKRLDLESLVVDPVTSQVLLVSEGSIKNDSDPSFIRVDSKGRILKDYKIPQYFKAKGKQQPRHNGVFEGLTTSFDKQGYWIATELPLKLDGPKPKYTETTSPVRFTYFNKKGEATKQFAYLLDKIAKKPLGDFAVNGITDILTYAQNKQLVIERSYSSGYGNQGNVIKIYSIDYKDAANTLKYKKLTKANYYPVKKELVFDFETIRDSLTNKSIDNVEGLCFGPVLPNGNRTLLFITDNDFNKQGDRQNQVILMEMISK